MKRGGQIVAILDAKWKTPDKRPKPSDLQQLYTYAHFHQARRVGLVYPQTGDRTTMTGHFQKSDVQADMLFVPLPDNDVASARPWMQTIAVTISYWLQA